MYLMALNFNLLKKKEAKENEAKNKEAMDFQREKMPILKEFMIKNGIVAVPMFASEPDMICAIFGIASIDGTEKPSEWVEERSIALDSFQKQQGFRIVPLIKILDTSTPQVRDTFTGTLKAGFTLIKYNWNGDNKTEKSD